MKKTIVTTFLLSALLGSTAMAADLARPMYKAAPPPAPVWSWTGFYIGGHVGAGWETSEADINSITAGGLGGLGAFNLPFAQVQGNGFLAGGQVGWNYQVAPWAVIGVEGDFSWNNIKGTAPCLVVLGCEAKHDWVATVAGRFGVTFDRALLYVKGGVAFAQATYTSSLNLGGAAFSTSVDDTRVGALFGTGIEYAFTPNWSAKIEYNYIDFGHEDYNFPIAVGGIVAPGGTVNIGSTIHEKMHLVKAGLNYKFDWGAPVVARY